MNDRTTDMERLIALSHHRWNIPVLAELQRGNGAKHITLLKRLQPGRASLSASLKHLLRLGLVRRNKGFGHPMRPEYLLTSAGKTISEECLELVRLVRKRGEEKIAFSKWSLPLVAVIGGQTLRFNAISNRLDTASPRAITLALKATHHRRWVDRIIVSEYPLAAGYRLRPKANSVLVLLNEIRNGLN